MLIHVWVPGRFDRVGGIQAFSRFFVEALTATCDVRVLSLHDKGRDGCGDVSTPWRNLSFARMVFFAALRDRPDRIVLTHLHFAPVAKIIALLLRIPFDVVAHGVEAWRIDRKIVRWSLKSAERVLAVSKTTRERMYESGLVPMGRIQLLPNTADEDRFSLRPLDAVLLSRFGINAASRFLLTVCRLDASEQYNG